MFVALLTGGHAQLTVGSQLTLGAAASPAKPLVITSNTLAARLALTIGNDSLTDPPADFLTAWQVRLEIVPDAAAVGSLVFEGADKPADYLFNDVGHFGPLVVASGNRLFAQDFNIPASGGVRVPKAPSAGLIDVEFRPSVDALGRFGVFALAGLTNSEWTDAAAPVQRRRVFANIPDAGGAVRIADVVVTSQAEFETIRHNFQRTNVSPREGDLNADGRVDLHDFKLWKNAVTSTADVAHAPEPNSAFLLAAALALLALFRGGIRIP